MVHGDMWDFINADDPKHRQKSDHYGCRNAAYRRCFRDSRKEADDFPQPHGLDEATPHGTLIQDMVAEVAFAETSARNDVWEQTVPKEWRPPKGSKDGDALYVRVYGSMQTKSRVSMWCVSGRTLRKRRVR
mmetsp:Transcript_29515/g.73498  ORF Transcript_29515/g.73498 Transcript_29515/m.73498 type:complete len:131 (-) Transcript_29515:1185-1577(-)